MQSMQGFLHNMEPNFMSLSLKIDEHHCRCCSKSEISLNIEKIRILLEEMNQINRKFLEIFDFDSMKRLKYEKEKDRYIESSIKSQLQNLPIKIINTEIPIQDLNNQREDLNRREWIIKSEPNKAAIEKVMNIENLYVSDTISYQPSNKIESISSNVLDEKIQDIAKKVRSKLTKKIDSIQPCKIIPEVNIPTIKSFDKVRSTHLLKLYQNLKKNSYGRVIFESEANTLSILIENEIKKLKDSSNKEDIEEVKNLAEMGLVCFDKQKLEINKDGTLNKGKNFSKKNEEFLILVKLADKIPLTEIDIARKERLGSISEDQIKDLLGLDIEKLKVNNDEKSLNFHEAYNKKFIQLMEFYGYDPKYFM